MQVSTHPSTAAGIETRQADAQGDVPGDVIETIPVMQETVRIDKRIVETGRVLIHKTVREFDQPVELLLKNQELSVERIPVGRVVTEAPEPRQEGEVLIIPVLEEIMVVEKRLVLKEELHVRRKETERTVRDTVRLRTEDVTVEQSPASTAVPEPPIKET